MYNPVPGTEDRRSGAEALAFFYGSGVLHKSLAHPIADLSDPPDEIIIVWIFLMNGSQTITDVLIFHWIFYPYTARSDREQTHPQRASVERLIGDSPNGWRASSRSTVGRIRDAHPLGPVTVACWTGERGVTPFKRCVILNASPRS